MLYVLAAATLVAMVVLFWKGFGPEKLQQQARELGNRNRRSRGRSRPVAPDDDPDFLRGLENRHPDPDSDS